MINTMSTGILSNREFILLQLQVNNLELPVDD